MKLPDPTAVSSDIVAAIATRHALDARTIIPLPQVVIINTVYLLGDDLVLRVPRAHPAHVALMYGEAVAAPAARAVGVRTPRLVVFDDSLTLLPVPYTIYERVHGETLGLLDLDPATTPEAWRELGHDLAVLHAGVSADGPCGSLAVDEEATDPRALAEARASEGWFTTLEARWLVTWLDRIAPCAGRFGHPSQHQASAPCYDLDHLCRVMSELASHKEPDDPASPVCVPIQGRVYLCIIYGRMCKVSPSLGETQQCCGQPQTNWRNERPGPFSDTLKDGRRPHLVPLLGRVTGLWAKNVSEKGASPTRTASPVWAAGGMTPKVIILWQKTASPLPPICGWLQHCWVWAITQYGLAERVRRVYSSCASLTRSRAFAFGYTVMSQLAGISVRGAQLGSGTHLSHPSRYGAARHSIAMIARSASARMASASGGEMIPTSCHEANSSSSFHCQELRSGATTRSRA